MKQTYAVVVRGKQHEWSFHVESKPEHVEEWRADGLEVFEVHNSIPVWLPAGLVRPWCFVQDLFYLRNPFRA